MRAFLAILALIVLYGCGAAAVENPASTAIPTRAEPATSAAPSTSSP